MLHIIGKVTVLESVDAPGPTIKYIDQVVREAPDDVVFRYFSWPAALFGTYDVFHVHWPEFLIRSRWRVVAFARRLLFRLLLVRLRARGTRIVRTIHNLEPHAEGAPAEALLLERLDAQIGAWVRINSVTPFPPAGEHYTVLHGSYRKQFASTVRPPAKKGRILYIGRIEPYKGVEELARVFTEDGVLAAELRIVGKADDAMRHSIEAITATDSRVQCHFEFVSDDRLVAEISESELVVLPYREMHNSGIALIALSLNRPILVPDTLANASLSDEVGSEWVIRYRDRISGTVLRDALAKSTGLRDRVPYLDNRDWSQVAEGYAAAFRGAKDATQ
ncbi:glycosyl transferase [Microbacterium sp. NPDC076911]|uniref:glycosyltransferase n=1 Tax=Microbacterium sp. NPDC076911 TaxID=3154958 RepID=UPI00343A82D5